MCAFFGSFVVAYAAALVFSLSSSGGNVVFDFVTALPFSFCGII